MWKENGNNNFKQNNRFLLFFFIVIILNSWKKNVRNKIVAHLQKQN